jgi:hypothetical protein
MAATPTDTTTDSGVVGPRRRGKSKVPNFKYDGPVSVIRLELDASDKQLHRLLERHWDTVERCVSWLIHSPELNGGSLVDPREDLIWRKVARHEPNKFVRTLQAAVSSVHASLRVPGVDMIFRPGWIDYESRPVNLASGEQNSDEYRAINPQGFVPMLEIDGHRLTQSVAIITYLDARYPNQPLLPASAAERAALAAVWLLAPTTTTFLSVCASLRHSPPNLNVWLFLIQVRLATALGFCEL